MDFLQQKVQYIKEKCLEMCINAGAGHVTSAFSCAEIVTALYYKVMRLDPENPKWAERDRFVMSKNHGSVILYPILEDLGFFSGWTDRFLKDGSLLGAHSKLEIPGVDFAGGSLGIGLGVACGMAYVAKKDEKDWMTFVIVGDGECYEGSIWESIMFAGSKELDNLVVFLDRNGMCVTGFTEQLLKQEPIADKWKAFNWDVKEIDGHCFQDILDVMEQIHERKTGKPLCVIAKTVKGHGIAFMENNIFMHGVAPSGKNAELARQQLKGEMSAHGA